MKRKRPPRRETGWWFGGFLFGFAVGLALSLTYGWLLDPRPLPITPADLRPADKAAYLRLIALAFAYDHDESRATARLATLGEPNIDRLLTQVTETYINREADIRDILALIELAQMVGEISPLMVTFLSTPTATSTATPTPTPTNTTTSTSTPTATWTPSPTSTPTRPTATVTPTYEFSPTPTTTRRPTWTPTVTPTPRPTRTPRPTAIPTPDPEAPFRVIQSRLVCDQRTPGVLQIFIRDSQGQGVPGVEIKVSWPDQEDRLFTGFKPDVDPGYADIQIELDTPYQIELVTVDTLTPLPEITLTSQAACRETTPSWQLIFQQRLN